MPLAEAESSVEVSQGGSSAGVMEDGSGGGCLVSAKTSHLERVGERDPVLTLADFEVPLPLHCGHCDRRLPKSMRIELQKPYVVAARPKCGLLTPFMLEPS
jgi:hypothetical protein